jgi:hypothetical protein
MSYDYEAGEKEQAWTLIRKIGWLELAASCVAVGEIKLGT